MLKLAFTTIHPAFIEAYARFGVFQSAISKNLIQLSILDLRQFAVDKHGSVDASPYGGGDGMVLRPEPLRDALASLPEKPRVILTSPGGRPFRQEDAQRLSESSEPLLFVCGRFAGVDQRFIDRFVDEEFSVGDFVVSGGELPALSCCDAILRCIPGVLGHADSAVNDSFASGMDGGLEYPLYTRPREFEGMKVPDILLSGDHVAIAKWRREQALKRTKEKRPDLLSK